MKQRGGWSSAWMERLAICSVGALVVQALALLHANHRYSVPEARQWSTGPEGYALEMAWKAAPLGACFTALLLTPIAVWVAARGQRLGAKGVLRVWAAAVIGGCVVVVPVFAVPMGLSEWIAPLSDASYRAVEAIGSVFDCVLPVVLVVSLGVFYLVGLPCLVVRKLRDPELVDRGWFAAWMVSAVIIGGLLLYLPLAWNQVGSVLEVLFPTEGLEVLMAGTLFTWGAGLSAHRACRRQRGQKMPPPVAADSP